MPPVFQKRKSCFEAQHDWTVFQLRKFSEEDTDKPESEKRIMAHQLEALEKIKTFFESDDNGPKHGLVVMPTGTGKSLVALLAPYFIGVKNKVMIITPSKVINRQLEADATGSDQSPAIYVRIGIVNDEQAEGYLPSTNVQTNANLTKNKSAELIIANYQQFTETARSVIQDEENRELNPKYFSKSAVDLVVVDEAHHYPAKTLKRILRHYREKNCLFITATPFRREGSSEVNLVGNSNTVEQVDQIYRFSRCDAVRLGVIRQLRWVPVQDQAGIDAALAHILKEPRDPVQPRRQAMALTSNIKDCQQSAQSLQTLGINANSYFGNDREHILRQFKAGSIQVLSVCGKLLEGFDHAKVSVCAIRYPTQSIVRFHQFAGRCIRIDRHYQEQEEALLIGPEKLTPFYERMANEEDVELPNELPVEDPVDDEA